MTRWASILLIEFTEFLYYFFILEICSLLGTTFKDLENVNELKTIFLHIINKFRFLICAINKDPNYYSNNNFFYIRNFLYYKLQKSKFTSGV